MEGLDIEVVGKILDKFDVIGEIKNGEQNLETSYIKILETINYIPKTTIFEKFLAYRKREIASNRLPRTRRAIASENKLDKIINSTQKSK